MKVTRYPQSCLLLEKNGHAIVIDPGSDFLKTHMANDLAWVSAVLYTHQHSDHYDSTIASTLKSKGIPLYANTATAGLIGEGVTIVQDTQEFEISGFTITARELPHALGPDGTPGPQNTGYLIDGIFFHPGDGKEIENLTVSNLALPIVGADISMMDAFKFAQQVQAKVVLPIHYDRFGADAAFYKTRAAKANMPFEMRVLADGESTEIS